MEANRQVYIGFCYETGFWDVILRKAVGFDIVKSFLTEQECRDYIKSTYGEFNLTEVKTDDNS